MFNDCAIPTEEADFSREIVLVEQHGRIRILNKDLYGIVPLSRLGSGRYPKNQDTNGAEARLKAHTDRIVAEQLAMVENGLNPHYPGSAGDFGRL